MTNPPIPCKADTSMHVISVICKNSQTGEFQLDVAEFHSTIHSDPDKPNVPVNYRNKIHSTD